MTDTAANINIADFQPLVGESFSMIGAELDATSRLAEVKELGSGVREGGGFSLVFVTPKDAVELPQGLYHVESGDAGFDLFLVPIGPFDGGFGYEAIFN